MQQLSKLGFVTTFILLASISTFFQNCANRIPPTGGNKDTLSPALVQIYPEYGTTNYDGNVLELTFDEWIKQNSIKTKLVVTPSIKDFDYKIKKNRVRLIFKEELQDTTTYSFDFRDAIGDINENNIAKNVRTAFSTGDFLDSMLVAGNVKELFTNQIPKEITIGLYKTDDTLEVTKDPAYYLSFTDEFGNFLLGNIKIGTYRFYAFQDGNLNKFYDEGEPFAFLTDSITLQDSNLVNIELKIALEDHTSPEITRARAEKSYFVLGFSEGISKFKATIDEIPIEDSLAYILEPDGTKVRFFNNLQRYDSIPLLIYAEDSVGNKLEDTLNIAFDEEKQEEKDKFTYTLALLSGQGIEKDLNYELKFNKPIEETNLEKVFLVFDESKSYLDYGWLEKVYREVRNDSIRKYPILTFQEDIEMEWDDSKTILQMNLPIDFENNVEILINEEAFFSVDADTNKVYSDTFTKKNPREHGTIDGQLVGDSSQTQNYIIQLLSESFEVIQELKNQTTFEFQFIEPGSYWLRVILDENGNGRWDGSDFKNKKQAEKIILTESPIKIRANWDIQDLKINVNPQKYKSNVETD